jgi:phosphoribosylformylglycinamidine synthase PurS subunit
VERVVLPDATILLDYLLVRFRGILEGLQTYPDRMRQNLELTGGLIFSEAVLLALVDKGLSRDEAYRLVQRHAMKAWESRDHSGLPLADPEVRHLSPAEIENCRSGYHLRHLDETLPASGSGYSVNLNSDMLIAKIYVTLKPGVLDAQGDTVKSALETLGFTGVEDVRIGKFMVVTLNSATREQANAQVEEMCRRLLANPVIEEYTFELEGAEG